MRLQVVAARKSHQVVTDRTENPPSQQEGIRKLEGNPGRNK
jgi:hypothetical protein